LTSYAEEQIKVVIGTPIDRKHAYILDKLLDNQKKIQQAYRACELVLATSEKDYARELKGILSSAQLRGKVLTHVPKRPDYSRHWVWDVTSGREAIRKYALTQKGADHLLFLDADMLFESDIVNKMLRCIEGYDALFNGYALRGYGTGLAGAGCLMLKRWVLDNIHFRCCEFKNGEVIFEDNLLEMDLFRLHARVRKGIFVASDHYQDAGKFKHLEPHSIGPVRRLANHPLVRYILIGSSLTLHYNIPWRLKDLMRNLAASEN
jgi:hypothetical protein